MKVTRDNDFTMTIAGYVMDQGRKVRQDLATVQDLKISITNAPRGSYDFNIDQEGRLVLHIDGPKLTIGEYGLVAKGIVNGQDWCWSIESIFEIVRHTEQSDTHDTGILELACEPAGINVTTLKAKVVGLNEYQNGEHDQDTLYIIYDDTQEGGF